jgi:site-specific DNA recombinase
MNVAIYARSAAVQQGSTSIEDQINRCRRYAALKGWSVVNDYVRSDSGASGTTLNHRDGLNSLIADAKKSPRPFDCLLTDDTSRLGRNLTTVLMVSDTLKQHGVFLFFVSQQLDSREKSFRELQIMTGMMDEQFLVELADKVHRSQEGKLRDASIIRRIFDMWISGYSRDAIAKQLNVSGIPAPPPVARKQKE